MPNFQWKGRIGKVRCGAASSPLSPRKGSSRPYGPGKSSPPPSRRRAELGAPHLWSAGHREGCGDLRSPILGHD